MRDKKWIDEFKDKKVKIKKSKFAGFQKENQMTFSVELDIKNQHNPCCGNKNVQLDNILAKNRCT